MSNLFVLSLLVAFLCVRAELGVDLSSLVSEDSFACMRGQGYTFVSMRCWRELGSPDPNCPATIANAAAAGMTTAIYFFPDAQMDAATQMNDAVQFLQQNNVQYGMMWLDIEIGNWADCATNYAFLQNLTNAALALNVHFGIYSSEYEWGQVMCGQTGWGKYPLWYAHYDNAPDFNDWVPFADWTTPVAKQYAGDVELCNANVDLNYVPDGLFDTLKLKK